STTDKPISGAPEKSLVYFRATAGDPSALTDGDNDTSWTARDAFATAPWGLGTGGLRNPIVAVELEFKERATPHRAGILFEGVPARRVNVSAAAQRIKIPFPDGIASRCITLIAEDAAIA